MSLESIMIENIERINNDLQEKLTNIGKEREKINKENAQGLLLRKTIEKYEKEQNNMLQ